MHDLDWPRAMEVAGPLGGVPGAGAVSACLHYFIVHCTGVIMVRVEKRKNVSLYWWENNFPL